jgi:serine O-acetyltransferase
MSQLSGSFLTFAQAMRLLPHLLAWRTSSRRDVIAYDVIRWWDEMYAHLKFSGEDILDLESMANRLRQSSQAQGIIQYVADRFSSTTKNLLLSYEGGPDPQLRQALVGELNKIVQSSSIYDSRSFVGVSLSGETQHLLENRPRDYHFLRLNRLLLEDAFPNEISRCEYNNLPVLHEKSVMWAFLLLMSRLPEFRSLFYYRIKGPFALRAPLKILCPPLSSLYIQTPEIGPGLFIQHGFATIISAKRIGRYCYINQQVTIGYSESIDCPTIGNNVHVYAGAKIIGGVTVGDNVKVGANAVVVKDVPANCTVAGVPARIVREDGTTTDPTRQIPN